MSQNNLSCPTVGTTSKSHVVGFHCIKYAYVFSLSLSFQNQLKSFMDRTFEKIQNTERALYVLKKFER